MKKLNIGLDLDGVLADKPPLVPKKIIEYLFRGTTKNILFYRFPRSKIEQLIRKISHYYWFRPPIRKNIDLIKNLALNKKHNFYLISSRYSFIFKETDSWIKRKDLERIFQKKFLNSKNAQPHFFKKRIIGKLNLNVFIDDDYLIAEYLAKNFPNLVVYCLSEKTSQNKLGLSNLKLIKELKQAFG